MSSLAARLKPHESHADRRAMPDVYLVARLDGRNFSRLTHEVLAHRLEAPFDEGFHDVMLHTLEALLCEGFHIVYGHTHSDEISLLFHRETRDFGRRIHKIESNLAGLASAVFSMKLGELATFDCRLLQLPGAELVMDYFEWRQSMAYQNALHAHCYWALRLAGEEKKAAHERLEGLSTSALTRLLLERFRIHYDDLPMWQRRGVAMSFEQRPHPGVDRRTGEVVMGTRRGLVKHGDTLPCGRAYRAFVEGIMTRSETPSLQ